MEPQVFNLIVYLVEHRDRVVTRQELFDTLWKDRVVSDSVLSARLKDARKAIGDSGERQALIKTLHSRGYQFVAEVLQDTPPVASDTASISPEKLPTIAVLPFTNLSNDPEQDYFVDGITEDVITELSRFRSLLVIARNSVFNLKEQARSIAELTEAYGIHYLVEGSVRKSGQRVRINVQLVETSSGKHLWAERYDRDLDEVFATQDEVVGIIAGKIPGTLERYGVEIARRKPPDSASALDLLLRGRWSLHHTNEGTLVARDYLQRAVSADEKFAKAHAHLAYAYAFSVFTNGEDPGTAAKYAIDHAIRAVTLDSQDPDVNAVSAIAFLLSGDYQRADNHSQRAIEGNPNDQMVLYSRGLILAYLGRPKEAMPCFTQMERIDPFAPDDIRADGFCDCLFFLGDYEKMLDIYRGWVNLPPYLYLVRAAALAQLGQLEEARKTLDDYRSLDGEIPDPTTFVDCQMRMVARPEDRERWIDAYRKAGISV